VSNIEQKFTHSQAKIYEGVIYAGIWLLCDGHIAVQWFGMALPSPDCQASFTSIFWRVSFLDH